MKSSFLLPFFTVVGFFAITESSVIAQGIGPGPANPSPYWATVAPGGAYSIAPGGGMSIAPSPPPSAGYWAPQSAPPFDSSAAVSSIANSVGRVNAAESEEAELDSWKAEFDAWEAGPRMTPPPCPPDDLNMGGPACRAKYRDWQDAQATTVGQSAELIPDSGPSKLFPKWLNSNGWFSNAKYAKQRDRLLAIDRALHAENPNLSIDSPEYFAVLGMRFNREFPGLFKGIDERRAEAAP